jgi:hypothetical protein
MRFNILWAKNNLSFDGIYNVLTRAGGGAGPGKNGTLPQLFISSPEI